MLPHSLLAVRLFLEPLRLWDYWPWMLLPLCFGVSLVYKCVRGGGGHAGDDPKGCLDGLDRHPPHLVNAIS